MEDVVGYLDFANHHADATFSQISELCAKVVEYGFNAAFVNPVYVAFARENLAGKGKVGTVVAFPLGQEVTEMKVAMAKRAVKDGADELDLSWNVGMVKEGKWEEVSKELKSVVEAVKEIDEKRIVKVILETGYLTDDEIKRGSLAIVESGADFVKTNSGMGPRGVKVSDVKLIRESIGQEVRVKAAGGVHTLTEVTELVDAGANRIGTSKAIEIAEEFKTLRS